MSEDGASGRPLSGLRVVEAQGGVATRYCGRLLAQLGAEVTRVGGAPADRLDTGSKPGWTKARRTRLIWTRRWPPSTEQAPVRC